MPAPLQRLRQGLLRHAGGDKIMAQVLAAVREYQAEIAAQFGPQKQEKK